MKTAGYPVQCYIIIPAYNEGKVIRKVINALRSEGYKHIIVVDDGSTDGTAHAARGSGVLVLHHRINRGKGASIKTGIEAAKQLGASLVVTFDGDGQHDPKDIQKFIELIHQGYDIVLGSRFIRMQQVPFYKRSLIYLANWFTWVLYGVWVTDSQCGLRAYSKRAFDALPENSDRYSFDTEVLRIIHKRHFRYTEAPAYILYSAYSQTKMNRQHIFSAILTMIKVFLSS